MTPLEQQFRIPEYTIPGEYFTPLTSPALEASNSNDDHLHKNNNNNNGESNTGYAMSSASSRSADIGFVASPIDMAHQFSAGSTPSSPAIVRRQRRKPSFSTRPAARLPRQSPSIRPNRKRAPTTTGAVGHQVETNSPRVTDDQSTRLKVAPVESFRQTGSNESSGQDSVSPEPLSEPLMPPPAVPRSNQSPNIAAQESSEQQKAREAATPATLMKLQNQRGSQSSGSPFPTGGNIVVNETPDEPMEDIALPEAASSSTQPTFSSGTVVSSNERTPTLSAGKTPTLRPNLGSSDKPGSGSVGPSPQLGAMASPSGPVGAKRSESKSGGRASKKRQSVSSSQASPALRPKISPGIQPLVRGDGVSAETSALYLASKSNYQHILEGTVLPGVSYPEALAENLSSKRTNHKLAEQGRRNRINTALKEIEALLPPSLSQAKAQETESPDMPAEGTGKANGATKSEKASANQTISKASTVEMAIVYIKALQKELSDTKEKLALAESKPGPVPPMPPPSSSSTASSSSASSESKAQHGEERGEKADAVTCDDNSNKNNEVSTAEVVGNK